MCVKEWAQVSVGAHSSEEGIGSSGATLGLWISGGRWKPKLGSSAREIHAPTTEPSLQSHPRMFETMRVCPREIWQAGLCTCALIFIGYRRTYMFMHIHNSHSAFRCIIVSTSMAWQKPFCQLSLQLIDTNPGTDLRERGRDLANLWQTIIFGSGVVSLK